MKLRIVLAALLAFCASAQPPTAAPRSPARPAAGRGGVAAASYKDLKFGPMRPVDPVQPVRFDLSNGMKVLLLEDHDTPMVTATAVVRTGSVFDPPNLAGLAAVTGTPPLSQIRHSHSPSLGMCNRQCKDTCRGRVPTFHPYLVTRPTPRVKVGGPPSGRAGHRPRSHRGGESSTPRQTPRW